ncbi:hypothetical protein FRC09_003706 [Ceratobasidium sp. 395]|nr:hypothetical protein FRC09_003706 [Ceratobasidium sp. 395]
MPIKQSNPWNLATPLVEKSRLRYTLECNDARLFSRVVLEGLPKAGCPTIEQFVTAQGLELKGYSFIVTSTRSKARRAVLLLIHPLDSPDVFAAALLLDVKGSLEATKIRCIASSTIRNLAFDSSVRGSVGARQILNIDTTSGIRNKGIINLRQNARLYIADSQPAAKCRRGGQYDAHAQYTASDFLRFLLNPDEIKATAGSVCDIIRACLTCAEKHVGKLSQIIEQKLDGLERTIDATFNVNRPAPIMLGKIRRPTLAKADTGISQADIPTLSNNLAPCVESVGKTAVSVLHFLLTTLRETNVLSIGDVLSGCKRLVGSALGTLCRSSKTVVRLRFTKAGKSLLNGFRTALFTPIANWKGVRWFAKRTNRNINPLNIISCILAFLINGASGLVEGGLPARLIAFHYTTSVDSNLKDPKSMAALNDIKDYIGSCIKALQIPTDIFAEPEIPVFGWGELILRAIILTLQFPRNRTVPGYNKRVILFICWASETIAYHLLLFMNLGHILISSRTLAAIQTVVSIFAFVLMVSMHWNDLGVQPQITDKARQIIYLNLSSATFGTTAGLAGKVGVILPDPSSRALCAVVMAVANKGNAIVQATMKVRRK